uniref:Uncharacterized protein n=1 Tax=Mycena chlorophos TaxID=658473 RepID=A0ABQ0KXX8_MYCCL|nr:predicted protein [Mycena chlorophos]
MGYTTKTSRVQKPPLLRLAACSDTGRTNRRAGECRRSASGTASRVEVRDGSTSSDSDGSIGSGEPTLVGAAFAVSRRTDVPESRQHLSISPHIHLSHADLDSTHPATSKRPEVTVRNTAEGYTADGAVDDQYAATGVCGR